MISFETSPFTGLVCTSVFAFALVSGTQPVIGVKDCAHVAVENSNIAAALTTNRIGFIVQTLP